MTRDPAVTSRIMGAIGNRDTKPEMLLRRELHRRGLRYRVRTSVFGHPDLVFSKAQVAVFVDGDYWHGNTWRLRGAGSLESYLAGRSNSAFWLKKIRTNIARDEDVSQRLTSEGWIVFRVWESDVIANPMICADQVERRVRRCHCASVVTEGTA
jgi:DNA mismatch endonuclease (patch repair protein)